MSEKIKSEIKEIFMKLGADVCGVANIDLFRNSPKGFNPVDIYEECRSVIVFTKKIPKGLAYINPRITYQRFNEECLFELDRIAYSGANEIENIFNGIAVPIPSDSPYDYWDNDKMEGRGIISMKHAAVLAGIGTLGKSTLLINAKYGNMLGVGCVLTDIDLPSDRPVEKLCIDSCRICIDNCPAHAISENGVDQKLCRNYTYGTNDKGFGIVNCNKCRVTCPMVFGIK